MNERCELPIPYPDELLYSVITRYHIRSNNTSPKWTLKEVYGTESVIPTVDLPSHLDTLAQRNFVKNISADQWIEEQTFYPYYAPFLPKDRALQLRQLMKSPNGSGIHALVGITASTIDRGGALHLCPVCYDDDIQYYGEPYWHRVHQLPGVWVCPIHSVILHQIIHPISERHGITVLPISRGMFDSTPIAESLPDRTLGHLSAIALDIQILMQMKDKPVLYNARHLLLPRLSEMGIATAGMRIRQQKLQEQFVTFYGHELLNMLECNPIHKDHSWLACSTRSMRYVVHPLRQILLFRFLYGSIKEFLSQSKIDYTPFGKGPWPCLNKAAGHYNELVIKQCQITRCSDTGRPVGTFGCDCGFSYSRRGPDQSDADKFHRGRIKSFGSIWTDKLQGCLQSGLSYRSTAGILGVDTNTVIKYRDSLVIEPKLISNNLKKKKQSQSYKSKEYKKVRVDWKKRDLELSLKVEEACKALLTEYNSRAVRICIATIGKRIDQLSMLEKNKDKLPITLGILSKYLESKSQFQIRRVHWAAEHMKDEGILIKWKLIKKAGLRSGYSQEVEDELNRCVGLNTVKYTFSNTKVTQ